MKKRKRFNCIGLTVTLAVCMLLAAACSNTTSPLVQPSTEGQTDESTTEVPVEDTATAELDTEESVIEEPTTEEATTEQPTPEETEPLEIPTTYQGETIVDQGNVGDHMYELLLPNGAFTFAGWLTEGAEPKDGFYYRDYEYPLVNSCTYTLYTDASLEADSFEVKPLTVMYAKATDRLHWVYMESSDASMKGWLSITLDEYQYYITPVEGAERIDVDSMELSFAEAYPQGGFTTSQAFGTLSPQSSFTADLEVGELALIYFNDRNEITAYLTEQGDALAQEPELKKCLEEAVGIFSEDADDAVCHFYLAYFRDATGVAYARDAQRTLEDGSKAYMMYTYYEEGSKGTETSGYYYIGWSTGDAPTFAHQMELAVTDTFE